MKPKTIIPLVLGVCVGGIAIKIVVDVVKNAQGASQANMTQCVVAKMDIGFADEVTPDKLMLKEWPKESLPVQYFGSIEELKDRVTSMFIPKDVPLYPSMLAPPGTPPGIQTLIRPGYRAVSVGIDEITGVAFQLKPSDWVDVISLVKRNNREGDAEYVSRVILQNVEIAAVGRALNSGKPGEAPKSVARSVTLLLKPEQVTQLHLAQTNKGKISLALRGNADDQTDDKVASATNDQLLGADYLTEAPLEEMGDPTPQPVLAMASEPVKSWNPAGPSWVVRVISGKKIELAEYRQQGGKWVAYDSGRPNHGGEPMPPAVPAPATPPADENHQTPDQDYGEEGQTADE